MQEVEVALVEPEELERGAGDVHLPVMADEVVTLFSEQREQARGGWIVDATLGAGGHSERLLQALPGVRVLGFDQDPEILHHAARVLEPYGPRIRIRRGRFSHLRQLLDEEGVERVVGWLFDLGASSLQFDRAQRGFSFGADGPLDMRMDPDRERTAADIVNTWDEGDLADLFFYEGGETRSRRIARAIVQERRRVPFLRTLALAELCKRTLGGGGSGGERIHPATRVFQALRRAVNEEGEELGQGLDTAEQWLVDGGLLVALSFHSGEDGAVKRFLAREHKEGRMRLLFKKPMRPSREDVRSQPRSRSAVLRAAVRTRSGNGSRADVPGGER